jgi:phosphatidylserine/phosphatidylglycerophosphate/cardiolipin synthase-like enzyme
MNFTGNDVYCHNNNAVRFAVPELARNYTSEMDEMYNERLFGPLSPDDPAHSLLTIDGVRLESYFASEVDVAPLIASLVFQAEESVQFMAFSFTRDDIGEAILERAAAGILIEGVFETTGSETQYSYYPVFRDAGLPNMQVLQDGNPRLMHHKVIIIDGEIVIFGSFNFSDSANDSNDENVVVIYDPIFARYFQEEFDFVWAEAEERDE